MDRTKPSHGSEATESLTQFKTKIASAIEGGWMTMGLALGHATGLFGVMCQLDTWASSTEIAVRGNCKERYVREWLYHMTSCDVIKMKEGTFIVPSAHREILTGDEIKQSVYILGLSFPFPQIVRCFQKEGPLGVELETVSSWLEFWENYRDKDNIGAEMLSQLSEEFVKQLEHGAQCCDLGGGRGKLMFVFASKYPKSEFTSFDCSQSALDDGMAEAERRSVTNVAFVQGDIHYLPDQWTNKFDYITMVHVLHNLPHPAKAMEEMFRVVKPGGFLSLIETKSDSDQQLTMQNKGTAHPPHILYAASLYYCLPVGLALPSAAGLGICPGHQNITDIAKGGGFESVEIYDVADSLHILCGKPRK